MTAVYVLRHPVTTWNETERYQGRLQAPLSAQGRQQTQLVSEAFAGQTLEGVYSSPLDRALDLARSIADVTGAPLYVDERLTEIAQCPWEGLHVSEIRLRYPEMYEEWYQRPDRVRFPGGENLLEVRDRALSVLQDLFARHPEGQVVMVTHSVVIQVMVATALSLDLRWIHKVRVSNAGITTLCGGELPAGLLSLNSTEALHGSAVASATAQGCATWRPRRVTQ
jgi:broad specificity phosphatase PhoE